MAGGGIKMATPYYLFFVETSNSNFKAPISTVSSAYREGDWAIVLRDVSGEALVKACSFVIEL